MVKLHSEELNYISIFFEVVIFKIKPNFTSELKDWNLTNKISEKISI